MTDCACLLLLLAGARGGAGGGAIRFAILVMVGQTADLQFLTPESESLLEHEPFQHEQTNEAIEEEMYEEEEDEEDAGFQDVEDTHLLCADYAASPRHQRLPDAVIIGARKGRSCVTLPN